MDSDTTRSISSSGGQAKAYRIFMNPASEAVEKLRPFLFDYILSMKSRFNVSSEPNGTKLSSLGMSVLPDFLPGN